MEGFNKAISFILGLVVVVVFIAVLTGRINLGKKITAPKLFGVSKTTPTPSPTAFLSGQKISSINVENKNNSYGPYNVKTNGTIPSTGAPVFLFPLAAASFLAGSFLRKSK